MMKISHLLLVCLAIVVSSCKPDAPNTAPSSNFVFTKDGIASPASDAASATPPVVAVGPSLILVSATPATGASATADVLVGNINSGEMVSVYTDKNCTSRVGGAISTSTSVLVTTSNLIIGDYLFYAKSFNAYGISSPCSSIPVAFSFTGVNPASATSMSLVTPTSTPNHVSAPIIRVSGVQSGDVVHLYKNSTCTSEVGNGVATAATIDIQTTPLLVGDYTFYTKSYNAYGISTACSTFSLAYSYYHLLDLTFTYDFIPSTTGKWDYAGTTQKPLRNIYVEIKKSSDGSLITSFSTDSNGKSQYYLNRDESIYFDIYAEMKSPSVIVQDNTNAKAKYFARTSTYNINADFTLTKNLASGWSGTNAAGSYTGTREAAPFAILDSIYSAILKINTARPSVVFPALKVNWSISNTNTSGDKTKGQIGSTHYNLSDSELYVLGKADTNADEYDRHRIIREWGRYFVAKLSRNDSMGGVHELGDVKDQTFAFSEGFVTALPAMVFDPDITHVDASGARQQTTTTSLNLENTITTNPGWYSEVSVAKIFYDLYDSTNFGETSYDNTNLGVGPLIDILMGVQFKNTTAMTSIFSFIDALKAANPGIVTDINSIVSNEAIDIVADEYGSTETHAGFYSYNLPLYRDLVMGGAAVSATLWGYHVMNYGDINSAHNNRYFKFSATSTLTQLSVTASDSFSVQIFNKGALAQQQPAPTPVGAPEPAPVYASWSYARTGVASLNVTLPNIVTVPGDEYIVRIYIDKNVLYAPATNNISVSLSGLGL